MSDMYEKFEKRFTESWFSLSWVEVQPKKVEAHEPCRKNLQELQSELSALKSEIEDISFKQARLSNLAKFYQQ